MNENKQKVVFSKNLKADLRQSLDEFGSQRVLIISNPSRRFVDDIVDVLGSVSHAIFDRARVHVPEEIVAEGSKALREHEADTIVCVGGGSATGLAKALKLEHDVRIIAVPTTYSGSERTSIYGIRAKANKNTGRDPKVRPDVVLYAQSLTANLPKALTTRSLLNALAHPISALSTDTLTEAQEKAALFAARRTLLALEELAKSKDSLQARDAALRAAAACGAVLHETQMGIHHRIAHFLGGRFDLDHAGLHAALLPHTVGALASSNPALFEKLQEMSVDLPGALFDLLRRSGAATSLSDLGVELDALEAALPERPDLPHAVVQRAFLGRRPSSQIRLEDWGLAEDVAVWGPTLDETKTAVVTFHGRGATAEGILQRVLEMTGDAPDVCVVAPQAARGAWYSKGYRASLKEHGDELTAALAVVDEVVTRVANTVSRVFIVGFSQGACLATEYVARSAPRIEGLIALSGARIGPVAEQPPTASKLNGVAVLLGVSKSDPWVDAADVATTSGVFSAAGADVEVLDAPGDEHRISGLQRIRARELILGTSVRNGHGGFNNTHETESLEGALPRDQNSPHVPAYGLYAEQVNATGFVAPRQENKRSWMYKIRPSAQHDLLEPLRHPTFRADFDENHPEPNLTGWGPRPIPEEATDFIDGLATFGGAGSAQLRRGFAIHLYAANRSMEDRAFYNSDGELLLVPELGPITLLTESGVLDVNPGMVAIVPRGLKFSVLLRDSAARGYVAEVFGRSFHLPERGPVGANGLTEARHFRAPTAYHENRLAPGYRITTKFCGQLFEARQDHSPFDTAAWHGNYAPYAYDLKHFSPVVNGRFDHADPSIFSVLSAPLDEQGAHSLDFVFFPPRWDVTEGTFRPPFFHRNAVTEFNGIIRDPVGAHAPFYTGGCFVTPAMTAHGVRVNGVEGFMAKDSESANRPHRFTDRSMWFQFETALPIYLTPWAKEATHRIRNWHHIWGAYRDHYRPR